MIHMLIVVLFRVLMCLRLCEISLILAMSYSGLFDFPVSLGIAFSKSVFVSNLNGSQSFCKISLLETCHL